MSAMMVRVAVVELHDEVVDWMGSLDDDEWDRVVVVIDRLAALGSSARMPLSESLKQRNNERTEIARARRAAEDCARRNP